MADQQITLWLSPRSRIYFSESATAPCVIIRDEDGTTAWLHLNNGELVGEAGRKDALAVLDALASAIVTGAKYLGVEPVPAETPDDDDDEDPDGIASHELVNVGRNAKCARCDHPHSAERIGDMLSTWCDECPCFVFVSPTAPISVHEAWGTGDGIIAQLMADGHSMAENELRAAHGDR